MYEYICNPHRMLTTSVDDAALSLGGCEVLCFPWPQPNRFVWKWHSLAVPEAAKKAAKATCVFDVGHAAFWLARVGTSITQAERGLIFWNGQGMLQFL